MKWEESKLLTEPGSTAQHEPWPSYENTGAQSSATVGGELSASRSCRFTSSERATATHWVGGWVEAAEGLEAVEKEPISAPCRKSKTEPTVVQPISHSLYWLSHLASLFTRTK
jgi:hypothetical protein